MSSDYTNRMLTIAEMLKNFGKVCSHYFTVAAELYDYDLIRRIIKQKTSN